MRESKVSNIDDAIAFMETEEFKTSMSENMDEWISDLVKKEKISDFQIERFHRWFSHDLNSLNDFINKAITHEESHEYYYYSYKYDSHCEWSSSILYCLYKYSKLYGKEGNDEQNEMYGNDFCRNVWILGDYVFQMMHGQGSSLHVFERDYTKEKCNLELF